MKEMNMVQPLLLISSGRGAPQYPDKDPPISSLPEKEFIQELLKNYGSTLKSVLGNDDLKEVFIPQLRADFELCETYRYRDGIEIDCPIVAYAGKEELDISESDLQGGNPTPVIGLVLTVFRETIFSSTVPRKRFLAR